MLFYWLFQKQTRNKRYEREPSYAIYFAEDRLYEDSHRNQNNSNKHKIKTVGRKRGRSAAAPVITKSLQQIFPESSDESNDSHSVPLTLKEEINSNVKPAAAAAVIPPFFDPDATGIIDVEQEIHPEKHRGELTVDVTSSPSVSLYSHPESNRYYISPSRSNHHSPNRALHSPKTSPYAIHSPTRMVQRKLMECLMGSKLEPTGIDLEEERRGTRATASAAGLYSSKITGLQ